MSTSDHHQRAAETKRRRRVEALLEAGERLITERGYQVSLDQIAAEAQGTSGQTARLYFKTKRELVAAIYHPFVVELDRQLDADLARMSALSALEELVRRMCVLTREHVNLTIAIMTAVREETVLDNGSPDADSVRRLVPVSAVMAKALGACRNAGQIPPGLPIDDVASYHANALLLRLFISADETAEEMAELVLSQLRPVLGVAEDQTRRAHVWA